MYKISVQKIKIYECKLVEWLIVKIEFEEKKKFCMYNYMLLNQCFVIEIELLYNPYVRLRDLYFFAILFL